jgi:hypothetical protein
MSKYAAPGVIGAIWGLLDGSQPRRTLAESLLDPQVALLRAWQSQRLSATYADLLDDPAYAPACRFFLSDVYGVRDFSERDQDIEQVHDWLARFLPEAMLALVSDTLRLNRMTYALDASLLHALVGQLGVTDQITPAQYAEAYRLCDNYAERLAQIDLIGKVLRKVGEGAHFPLVGLTLHLTRGPAQAAGWGVLHDTLARGHAAFDALPRPRWFASTIERREKRILDHIFAGEAEPFEV